MKYSKSCVLDLYTDYLIADFGSATATGFSRALDNRLPHDMVTQLLNSGYVTI